MRHRVTVVIDGHVPVALEASEAAALADVLWHLGEQETARGGVALSVALVDANRGGPPVIVDPSQVSALRTALSRFEFGEVGAFATLSRAVA